jgi:hypothetical protein
VRHDGSADRRSCGPLQSRVNVAGNLQTALRWLLGLVRTVVCALVFVLSTKSTRLLCVTSAVGFGSAWGELGVFLHGAG